MAWYIFPNRIRCPSIRFNLKQNRYWKNKSLRFFCQAKSYTVCHKINKTHTKPNGLLHQTFRALRSSDVFVQTNYQLKSNEIRGAPLSLNAYVYGSLKGNCLVYFLYQLHFKCSLLNITILTNNHTYILRNIIYLYLSIYHTFHDKDLLPKASRRFIWNYDIVLTTDKQTHGTCGVKWQLPVVIKLLILASKWTEIVLFGIKWKGREIPLFIPV